MAKEMDFSEHKKMRIFLVFFERENNGEQHFHVNSENFTGKKSSVYFMRRVLVLLALCCTALLLFQLFVLIRFVSLYFCSTGLFWLVLTVY